MVIVFTSGTAHSSGTAYSSALYTPVIEVVTRSFGTGSITSYNSEDKQAWSTINGRRGKDNMVDYAGEPRFYAANENNLQLLGQYNDLQSQLAELNKRCCELEKRLTEPITFEP